MTKYAALLCGPRLVEANEFGVIMGNLQHKLEIFVDRILSYNWESPNISFEIPFYARNLLETSLTAILSRTDPFRVITIFNVQSSPGYDLGKKSNSAIEWYGDIIGSKKPADLWKSENKKEAFDRALLSYHLGEIIWKPGFIALTDFVDSQQVNSDWISGIIQENANSNFERCKSLALNLFSSFSKGVHSESLVDISIMLDAVTLKDLVKDLFKLCATLGLISHFYGYLVPKLDKDEALQYFLEIERVMDHV